AREVDLFSGSAGVMLAGRIIGDILGTEWPLECAELARSKLERSFHPTGDIPLWRVDPESDTPYLGCAHGSSGIALALAHWGQRTGDREALAIALETFHKIVGRGRTEDGGALRMALDSTQFHAPGNWCHGTAGYLWAVLQAFGDHPDLRTEIDWAVASVQSTMVAGTPTYCHGLAGRLELWRLLGEVPRFRELAATQAGKTARALRVLHRKVGGRIAWMSDDPQVMTPDLWVGFLGPASALALHAAHASAPLLSGRWLAQCASGLGLVKRAPEKPVAHLAAGIARNDAQPI
ncbi:MAG TPA: lanthionine synthetase LanC family protein, partial [Nitrococcus sp.]|nr:lanthionine synthetase LanC family protein [Nitrococcus sp.]